MIRTTWRRAVRFLSSAVLATWLLAIVGLWSVLGSLVPQSTSSVGAVAAWDASHAQLEPVVRMLGLHHTFSSPPFLLCVLLLGVSTAICAWERTKLARSKRRILGRALVADERSVAEKHDLEIACAPGRSREEILSATEVTLARLGIKTKRRGDLITTVSARWTVWGSPIFHWALVGLMVALVVGNLTRAEGLMGIAVGQTLPDAPDSYGIVSAGPLRVWGAVHRSFRVERFETDYRTGGVDRGPTPTVSVLDGSGHVLKTQRVYPNMTLSVGSLGIYPIDFGLAARVSTVDSSGIVTARAVQLIDFSAEATAGNVPSNTIKLSDRSGALRYEVGLTVPLDRKGNLWLKQVPTRVAAHVVATTPDGHVVADKIVTPGEEVALPGVDTLVLDGVTYYARLQIVDDWTPLLLYAGLFVAMVGLGITVLTRQQIVLATVTEDQDGAKLVATLRLWRNASSTRNEIESELSRALGAADKGSAT